MRIRTLTQTLITLLLLTIPSTTIAQSGASQPVPTTITTIAKDLPGVRTLVLDASNNDILVLARGKQQVVALTEEPEGSGKFKQTVILDAEQEGLRLTHGMDLNNGWLYASSDARIYRWPYRSNRQKVNEKQYQVVLRNMEEGGQGGAPQGHSTRHFLWGPDNNFYVGMPSIQNVDSDSSRSRVRRFPFSRNGTIPTDGFDWSTGAVWADGLRNPLAMSFDEFGRLWEFDNGPDDLNRPDLAQRFGIQQDQFHNDNPCEELNILNGPVDKFYGYPDCFSLGNVSSAYPQDSHMMTQYAWPDNPRGRNDEWCQNPQNNQPPLACLPAHSSPIFMRFFGNPSDPSAQGCDSSDGAWPCEHEGSAFVTLHGSWNRDHPTGYAVVRVPFKSDSTSSLPIPVQSEVEYVVRWEGCHAVRLSDNGCFRPTGLVWRKGVMYVGSDGTGEVVRVAYGSNGRRRVGVSGSASGVQGSWRAGYGLGWGLLGGILVAVVGGVLA